jgi:hypothetical protein
MQRAPFVFLRRGHSLLSPLGIWTNFKNKSSRASVRLSNALRSCVHAGETLFIFVRFQATLVTVARRQYAKFTKPGRILRTRHALTRIPNTPLGACSFQNVLHAPHVNAITQQRLNQLPLIFPNHLSFCSKRFQYFSTKIPLLALHNGTSANSQTMSHSTLAGMSPLKLPNIQAKDLESTCAFPCYSLSKRYY